MSKEKSGSVKRLIYTILLFFLVFLIAKSYWSFLKSPLEKNGQTRAFVVQPGEPVTSISDRLEKEKFVRSSLVFNVTYKIGSRTKIEAGDFKLSSAMDTDEIIKNLAQGSLDKWVTLLEGWRVEEMAQKLNNDLAVNKDEFLKSAEEGYMFPDTYLLNPKASASDIVAILKNNFSSRYSDEIKQKVIAKGLTLEQGVILASLVEREARSDKARTEVASILLKRLKIEMGLNVDSTIQYALAYQSGEKSWWKRHLTKDDLKVNSPYNTYLHRGLPPAPICNPSLSSLKAVANASTDTPYLYYYHDSKGVSHYAATLQEHNDNISNFP